MDEASRRTFLTAGPIGIACYAYRVLENYAVLPMGLLIANDGVHAFGSLGIWGLINSRTESPYASAGIAFALGGAWELYQQAFMNGAEGRDLIANAIGIAAGLVIAKMKRSTDLEEMLSLP